MKIIINNSEKNFRPWRPELGQVFRGVCSFDSETTLIDEQYPWIAPAYVLGAVFDGTCGYFIPREHATAFFQAHQGVPVVMHNAPFDLAVLDALAPDLAIYNWVDEDLVWDTRLLHRLLMLATAGHTATGKGQSTLEHCAERYLGIALPKKLTNSRGKEVRLSYGQWLGRPPREIEPVYLEYLGKDAIVTYLLFLELRDLLKDALDDATDAFGYVWPKWLAEQVRRWGWQTHHIQLKAAIVLERIRANGLTVDVARRDELLPVLERVAGEQLEVLREQGYLPGEKGCGKALQEILKRLDARHPDLPFPRTATEKYATKREALEDLVGMEPFVDSLLKYREIEKLRSTFLDKMGRRVLHPSFDVLKTSGRTSSFGEINAQNLPRDDRVRACFVPSEGNVFIDADYKTLELATLAQSVIGQWGIGSEMARRINEGCDLHRLMAARVAGKAEDQVTREERQRAKAINFGKPGGMGNAGLKQYAKAQYGVVLTDEEVQSLTYAWHGMFPEMYRYLSGQEENLGYHVAEFLNLTPMNYLEHTGIRSFIDHPENRGREDRPHPYLGSMALKAFRDENPCRQRGVPYGAEEVDYFWSRLAEKKESLPSNVHRDVEQRKPSGRIPKAVMRLVDRGKVFTFTGRLRAGASFCARHNTPFQGLAADGAKLALWKLWRAGYRIVNFIHDEVLVEVPAGSNLKAHAEDIYRLMVEGMREVVPDVRIDVEYAAASRWYKKAEAVYDEEGNLLLWEPAQKETSNAAPAPTINAVNLLDRPLADPLAAVPAACPTSEQEPA